MMAEKSSAAPGGKTIWIINNYASHLEARHRELAEGFAANGYRAVVITSAFHHGRHQYLYDEPITYVDRGAGATFVYLKACPPYANSGIKRVLNMLDFCRMVYRYTGAIAEKIGAPQYIIASSAPPFVWEVGYVLARRFSARFIAEFRDIWPLSLVEIQGVPEHHPLVLLLSRIEKRAYRRADAIVSTMPYAWRHVRQVADVSREKIHWIPNGISTEDADAELVAETQLPTDLDEFLTNHWCCIYTGSIVKSECLDFLVEVWEQLRGTDIYLAFVGEGSEKERIAALIEKKRLDHVRMFPQIDSKLVAKALVKARCCVASYRYNKLAQFGTSLNKFNDYLYAGVPTVFACDGPNVVQEAGHFSIPYGDTARFAETIRQVRDLTNEQRATLVWQGREIIRKEYDYPVLARRYLDLMENCAGRQR